MKKSFICTLLLSLTAAAFGQIKMADESFKTKLEAIDLMSQPLNFDEIIPAYEPFKYRILYGACNEIGQKYLIRGKDKNQDGLIDSPFLKIDHNARKAEFVRLPMNTYVTITGMIIGEEMFVPLRDSLMTYTGHISRDPRASDNLSPEEEFFNRDKRAYDENLSNFSIEKYLGSNHRSLQRLMEDKRWDSSYVCLYKFEDESHNEYYTRPNEPEWISVSEYEALVELLKGQKVAISTGGGLKILHDAYTGNTLTNIRFSEKAPLEEYSNFIYFDYTCTDILLNEGDYWAVLENGDTRFTLEIKRIGEMPLGHFHSIKTATWSNRDGIGYFQIYPESEYKRVNRLLAQTAAEQRQLTMQEEAKRKAEEQKRQQHIINRYGTTYGNYIIKHQVALGMTQEMCREAWGRPLSQTSVKNSLGVSEVWTYGFGYLLFSNGELTEIKQTK